jgi:hypothetical protein
MLFVIQITSFIWFEDSFSISQGQPIWIPFYKPQIASNDFIIIFKFSIIGFKIATYLTPVYLKLPFRKILLWLFKEPFKGDIW